MYFPFSNGNSSAAWRADTLSQASLRDVQRQRCWKRSGGEGQRLWYYGTSERSFIAISALCIAVERLGSKLTARPSAAADNEKRQICMACVLVRGQR